MNGAGPVMLSLSYFGYFVSTQGQIFAHGGKFWVRFHHIQELNACYYHYWWVKYPSKEALAGSEPASASFDGYYCRISF